jgi:hypothetical protein
VAMRLLDVPHLLQAEPGWCLPACVSMAAAYWEQPLWSYSDYTYAILLVPARKVKE